MGRFNIDVPDEFGQEAAPEETPQAAAPQEDASKGGGRFGIAVPDDASPVVIAPRQSDDSMSAEAEYERLELEHDKKQDSKDKVPESEQYVGGDGVLGKVLEGLDYWGNISRSALLGAARAGEGRRLEGALKYGKQAYNKERRTEVPAVRKEVLGPVLGKDATRDYNLVEGEFDAGDVIDFMRDFPIGFFTDPATLVTAGLSRVTSLKGLSPVTTGAIAKVAPEAKAGIDATKALQAGKIASAGVAGAYGYGASDAESVPGRLATGAMAAGAVYGIGQSGKYLKAPIQSGMDSLVDWYKTASRGVDASGYSGSVRTLQGAKQRIDAVARDLVQRRLGVLSKLSPEEQARFNQALDEQASDFVTRRNVAKSQNPEWVASRQRLQQLANDYKNTKDPQTLSEYRALRQEMTARHNQITAEIGRDMTTPEYFQALVEKEGENIGRALEQHVRNNQEFVEQYNRVVNRMASGKWDPETNRGLVGIPWHTDNPTVKRSLLDMDQAFSKFNEIDNRLSLKFKEKYSAGRSAENANLDRNQTYRVYADRAARTFMTPVEVEAMKKVAEINAAKARGGYEAFEKGLAGFDWLTGIAKNNMLGLSFAWLKNNFSDGLLKSFFANDLGTIAKSKVFPALNQKIVHDIMFANEANVSRLLKSKEAKELLDEGVVSSNFFVDKSDDMAEFYFRPEQIAEAKAANQGRLVGAMETIRKGQDAMTKPVFATGRFMEDFFRANTYLQVKKSLEVIPSLTPEARKKIAAQVVRDTFFDYDKVHLFEKAVMKRLMPFYTFYSRNVGYWAKQATAPSGLLKIQAGETAKRQIGRAPTTEEYESLPQYMQQGPRILSAPDEEDLKVLTFPQSSLYDAINTTDPNRVMGLKDTSEFIQRGNPWLKLGVEAATGRDLFTGNPLYPSEHVRTNASGETKVKPLSAGARGYPKAVLNKSLTKLGFPQWLRDIMGVGGSYIDPDTQKSVSTRDEAVLPGKVLDLITPPLVTQVSNLYLRPQIETERDNTPVWFNTLMTPQMYVVPEETRGYAKFFNSTRK